MNSLSWPPVYISDQWQYQWQQLVSPLHVQFYMYTHSSFKAAKTWEVWVTSHQTFTVTRWCGTMRFSDDVEMNLCVLTHIDVIHNVATHNNTANINTTNWIKSKDTNCPRFQKCVFSVQSTVRLSLPVKRQQKIPTKNSSPNKILMAP